MSQSIGGRRLVTAQRSYILFPLDAATPPLAPPRHFTKTELALELLRERIRSGELAPGQRLALEELTQSLGMSATPIREALRLLQADQLVDYRPHHGVVVKESPPEATVEIYRIKSPLEPLSTELEVESLSDVCLAELERRVSTVGRLWGDDRPAAAVLAEKRDGDWIAGTVDEVVERLRGLREAGVERVMLQHLDHADVEMVDLLGTELAPRVAGL